MNVNVNDVRDALYELGIVTVEQMTTGTLIDGRSISEFKVYIEERPPLPDLGVKVSDGLGVEDEVR